MRFPYACAGKMLANIERMILVSLLIVGKHPWVSSISFFARIQLLWQVGPPASTKLPPILLLVAAGAQFVVLIERNRESASDTLLAAFA